MTAVTRQLFYTAFIIHIIYFFIVSTYGIQDPEFEYSDIMEYTMSWPDGNTIKDKIKNIINEDNYKAIMHMKNKLMNFFEFPFKYFAKIFKKLFSRKKNKTVRFISSNSRNVMPSAKVNLSDHIHSDDNTTTTEVTEATTVTEINITPPKFSPTWCLKPQHYFSF